MTLLGGEPLLARNRELVLYILRQGVERGYEFSVISNATELDAFLPELAGLNVKFIQITLDGLKHTHDRRRFGPQREGSFDRIVPNVGRALRAGLRVSLRVNVDATNFDEVRALAELAGREGWVGSPTFDMYVAPVYTGAGKCGLDESVALPDAQLAEKMADLHRAVPSARIVRHAPAVERVFMGLFRSGQYLGFKGEFCGSSGAMHIFDPYGKMYACWESVGQRVGELGSYFPQVAYDEAAVESWRGRVVTSIPQCRACKYALLCGGGCPQHAYNANGSLRSPACRDFQRVLDTGLPVFYRKFLQEQGAGREGAVPGQAQPPGMGATVGAVAGERG